MEPGPGGPLELVRRCGVVQHSLLQDAEAALGRLKDELQDIDSHLEAESLHLAREWHQLKVAVNLSRLQHESTRSKDVESLAAVKGARDRALEEAEATDRRREAAERREQALQASIAALERQARAREAALIASAEGPSTREVELRARKDALALTASEQSL